MKKLLIIMTLFMSSFFLFSLEDVKAYEHSFDIDFTYLDEEFYIIKNLADEFVLNDDTYSDNYFIYRNGSSLKLYVIFLPLDYSYNPDVIVYTGYASLRLYVSGIQRYVLSSDYLSLVTSGTASSFFSNLYKSNSNVSDTIPLYANFDILMSSENSGSTLTYKYDTFITFNTANGIDKFKTLYDIYEEYNSFIGNEEQIHKEELEKVGSFYNIIIQKLGYLAEIIVSNYIYLSIIVIFILIFVFLLIFRRFIC